MRKLLMQNLKMLKFGSVSQKIVSLLAWLLYCCVAAAQDQPTGGKGLASAAETDQLIRSAMDKAKLNGLAAAVIDDGKIVYLQAFGRRNDLAQPLRQDTVMLAASLTKPAFAYMVMQLADEGKINLDEPIAHYLPQALSSYARQPPYPAWSDLSGDERWRAITPRMLLSHQSGLPNIVALEWNGRLRIHFAPGARFAYSGVGINLLQFVLERGLGLNVEAEFRHRVIEHFDMHNSSLTWMADHADNQANGYTSNGSERPHPRRLLAAAASSLETSVEDYASFLAGLVRGVNLSATAHQAMLTAQGKITTASEFPTFQDELSADRQRAGLATGLGLILFDGPQGAGFFKGGHGDATGNIFVCIRNQARCVLLLSNDVRSERVFPEIVDGILGKTGMPWEWEYGK